MIPQYFFILYKYLTFESSKRSYVLICRVYFSNKKIIFWHIILSPRPPRISHFYQNLLAWKNSRWNLELFNKMVNTINTLTKDNMASGDQETIGMVQKLKLLQMT